ncbi:hypothetical protein EDWATA_03345 [Edwardsiella tarda ATCC 23685]|uniref:Uncharacterized protein n=1 Tax=Edwardsiella tarda ATCC 23685 TaxID=500638 RepID=D4F987_EDWTA|nr:hypothetical protein EDWATA_03345 [Edwardsiella tarda ATCC 23685]
MTYSKLNEYPVFNSRTADGLRRAPQKRSRVLKRRWRVRIYRLD